MLRTEVARRTIGEVATASGHGVLDAAADRDFVSQQLTTGEISLPSIAESALESSMADLRAKMAAMGLPPPVLTPEQKAQILAVADRFNSGNVSTLTAVVSAVASAPSVRKTMEEQMSGERIQKKALTEDLAPAKRVEALNDMTLTIVEYPDTTPLILGDDPVLGFREDGAPVRAVLPFDPPSVLALPVTPTKAIVLHRVPIDFLRSAAFVNEASATMSHAQFVAQAGSTDFAALLGRVGTFQDPIRNVNWKGVAQGRNN